MNLLLICFAVRDGEGNEKDGVLPRRLIEHGQRAKICFFVRARTTYDRKKGHATVHPQSTSLSNTNVVVQGEKSALAEKIC